MTEIGEMIDEEIPQNPVKQSSTPGEQENQEKAESSKSAFSLLKAKSPNKPVEAYMDSSINIFGTEWFARILKGCEGLLGEQFADYAVFDILRGTYEGFFKSRNTQKEEKQEVEPDESEN